MKTQIIHSAFKIQGKAIESVSDLISTVEIESPQAAKFLNQWFDAESHITVFTSGSTGKPKSIDLLKESMVASARATGSFFNLGPGSTALLCMPVDYIAGKMMLIRALVLGWELHMVSPDSRPLKNSKKKYDFTAMVPMQLYNSLADLHRIKKLIVGGGAVSNDALIQIQNIDTEVYATYGMTETITHIALRALNCKNSSGEASDSNFKALPGVKFSVDNRDCLVIDAPYLSLKKLVTNDVVELLSESSFRWIGRIDSVINSGGIKLFPEQIEAKLEPYIKTRFFVFGIDDYAYGERLVLCLEGEYETHHSTQQLILQLRNDKDLKNYEIPKTVYFVKSFVLTKTGKLNREATKKMIDFRNTY